MILNALVDVEFSPEEGIYYATCCACGWLSHDCFSTAEAKKAGMKHSCKDD